MGWKSNTETVKTPFKLRLKMTSTNPERDGSSTKEPGTQKAGTCAKYSEENISPTPQLKFRSFKGTGVGGSELPVP